LEDFFFVFKGKKKEEGDFAIYDGRPAGSLALWLRLWRHGTALF
jgi:hypothetical protein